ncbi:hypothetical protein PUW75_08725 [Streptococcus anginosus]|nr:hypothetical protein PUW75_08725 [Streptococcus anginosus]
MRPKPFQQSLLPSLHQYRCHRCGNSGCTQKHHCGRSRVLHGLGYGDNAKAAIITRGLAEITRLGVKLGASPLTYSGLSGVGDLIVTGTSVHSRNWRAGDALGRGEKLEDIEANMGMVIEGISTTKAAYELAQELGVYMPITQAIYHVIYESLNIKDAIYDIMNNEFKAENEWS